MARISDGDQVFFSTKDVARRWRISPRTIEGWRDKGISPRYYKIGNRVRYHIEDIERAERDWSSIEENASRSNSSQQLCGCERRIRLVRYVWGCAEQVPVPNRADHMEHPSP